MSAAAQSTWLAAVAGVSLAILHLARARRRRFAAVQATRPVATTEALEKHRWLALRHDVLRGAIAPRELEAAFDAIRAAFAPQQVDYSNTAYGKDHWNLSCFMEYSNGVAAGKVDLGAGAPMLAVCDGILRQCDAFFLKWYDGVHPYRKGAARTLHRLQSFVTRYRPNPDETHLPRHIDGANVDGSVVLGLPTYSAYGGGGLTGEQPSSHLLMRTFSNTFSFTPSHSHRGPHSVGRRWRQRGLRVSRPGAGGRVRARHARVAPVESDHVGRAVGRRHILPGADQHAGRRAGAGAGGGAAEGGALAPRSAGDRGGPAQGEAERPARRFCVARGRGWPRGGGGCVEADGGLGAGAGRCGWYSNSGSGVQCTERSTS